MARVFGLRQEALSRAFANLGSPRGLRLGTAEPDKPSVAARDLWVCRFLWHLAEPTGGSLEQVTSAVVAGSHPPNGGMADVRQ